MYAYILYIYTRMYTHVHIHIIVHIMANTWTQVVLVDSGHLGSEQGNAPLSTHYKWMPETRTNTESCVCLSMLFTMICVHTTATTARGSSESGTKTDYEPCHQCHPRVVWQLEWNGMERNGMSTLRPRPPRTTCEGGRRVRLSARPRQIL